MIVQRYHRKKHPTKHSIICHAANKYSWSTCYAGIIYIASRFKSNLDMQTMKLKNMERWRRNGEKRTWLNPSFNRNLKNEIRRRIYSVLNLSKDNLSEKCLMIGKKSAPISLAHIQSIIPTFIIRGKYCRRNGWEECVALLFCYKLQCKPTEWNYGWNPDLILFD